MKQRKGLECWSILVCQSPASHTSRRNPIFFRTHCQDAKIFSLNSRKKLKLSEQARDFLPQVSLHGSTKRHHHARYRVDDPTIKVPLRTGRGF